MKKLFYLATSISILTSITFISMKATVHAATKLPQNNSAVQISEKLPNKMIAIGPDWMQKFPRVKNLISNNLAEYLRSRYAQGNRKGANVEALEVRVNKIYMQANIHHEQRTDLPFGKHITTYAMDNKIETTFDPLNPDATLEKSRLCFVKGPQIGGGKICITAGDVVRIISASL
jgi:hypothetical protein